VKPTVQHVLAQAITAAAAHPEPGPLERLLDGMSEILWDADRRERNGGRDPHEFLNHSGNLPEKAAAA